MRKLSKIMHLYAALGCAGVPSCVLASGFALIEQNASGLGNAYAGQAAVAEDASTVFFNPAGMTKLSGRQILVAGHIIVPSAKFNDTGSSAAGGGFALGANGVDGGSAALVPSLYATWAIDSKWSVGVGITVPFGLKTDYDADWIGRFHALKSEIKTLNVNPSIAFKINDALSIGAGINFQHIEAEITKAVNYTAVGAALGVPLGTAGSNKIDGKDNAWGFNLGVLINPAPNTNIGLTYRSAMAYKLSGAANYFGRPTALNTAISGGFGTAVAAAAFDQVGDGPITADLKLPASFSAALKHQINPTWDVLADATWTQWSSLKTLDIVRSNGALIESTPFEWRNTWRVGFGFNYRPNDAWTVRTGVAYDQTPTSNTYRIPRLPDESRTWLAIGGQYKVSKVGAIDFGYAHLFVNDPAVALTGLPTISAAAAAGRGNLVGNYRNSLDIVSIQYRHTF